MMQAVLKLRKVGLGIVGGCRGHGFVLRQVGRNGMSTSTFTYCQHSSSATA